MDLGHTLLPSLPRQTTSLRRMYVEAVNCSVTHGRRRVRLVTPVKPHLLTGRSAWRLECARLPSRCEFFVFAALASLQGCDPCIGQSVAFINHTPGSRKQHVVFSRWYRVSRTFFRPPVRHSGASRSRASHHALIVTMTSAKGCPYTPPWRGWKHLRFAPVLSNVRAYADQQLSCRACCPDQLLHCSYWARCGVCHPVRYRPRVVYTVREYFASLAIGGHRENFWDYPQYPAGCHEVTRGPVGRPVGFPRVHMGRHGIPME